MKGMSLSSFKDLNRQRGFHWFDKLTLRYFNSKISNWDYDTGYFVSSEIAPDQVRAYTLRRGNFDTGRVMRISEFREYRNIYLARQALVKRIEREKNENTKN